MLTAQLKNKFLVLKTLQLNSNIFAGHLFGLRCRIHPCMPCLGHESRYYSIIKGLFNEQRFPAVQYLC